MSQEKAKPAGGTAGKAGGKAIKGNTRCLDSIIETSPSQAIQKRRLSPQAGALIRLDVCEHRLHIANTTGDSDTWSRFYLAWLQLHSLAFSYGRWAREGSDG